MPAPAIGSLTPLASPGPSQFAGAIGDLPEAMREDQTRRTEQEATQLDAEAQKQAFGAQIVQRLAQIGMTNPNAAANPNFTALLKRGSQLSGIPIAMNADGTGYDFSAMIPKTPIPPELMEKLASIPPDQRKTILASHPEWSYDPGFAEVAAVYSATDKNDATRVLLDLTNRITDPKYSASAAIDEMSALVKQGLLAPLGITSTSSIFDDPTFKAAAEQAAQRYADDAHIKATSPAAIAQARDDIARARLAWQQQRAQMTDAQRAADRAQRARDFAIKAAEWDRKFTQTQQNFDRTFTRLQQAQQEANETRRLGLVASAQRALQANVNSLQNGYDSLEKTKEGYTAAGADVPPELQARLDALGQKLTDAQAALANAAVSIPQDQTNAVRVTTGATSVQVPPARIPGTFSNGKRGYSQGGAYFLEDGTPVDENGNRV